MPYARSKQRDAARTARCARTLRMAVTKSEKSPGSSMASHLSRAMSCSGGSSSVLRPSTRQPTPWLATLLKPPSCSLKSICGGGGGTGTGGKGQLLIRRDDVRKVWRHAQFSGRCSWRAPSLQLRKAAAWVHRKPWRRAPCTATAAYNQAEQATQPHCSAAGTARQRRGSSASRQRRQCRQPAMQRHIQAATRRRAADLVQQVRLDVLADCRLQALDRLAAELRRVDDAAHHADVGFAHLDVPVGAQVGRRRGGAAVRGARQAPAQLRRIPGQGALRGEGGREKD